MQPDIERVLGSGLNWISTMQRTKLEQLWSAIDRYKSIVVAFSGGVDSTFLAWACKQVVGDKLLLVTAISETYPSFERQEAEDLAKVLNITQRIIHTEELKNPLYADNPIDRCYYCKSELFSSVIQIARTEGYDGVFEGGNFDDLADYRPGRRAIKELGVTSPLCDVGLTKNEIRELSKAAGLTTGNKPSYACLASRFPYGEHIDVEKLTRVEQAESAIRAMGFTQFRVRSHDHLARIELAAAEMDTGWNKRERIAAECKKVGYTYACIDLMGYRSGAMNEVLSAQSKKD